ncbi:MAG: LysR family transcriptional regulator [Ruminococcus flavefaciens]|nr:LysR family transcriptional regulator [Ruminococcus flavefaciens]MCM1228580.1 LysR family transcriptional regulator [Ruminococcus flavefaciens]
MKLQQLEYIIAIAQAGSITAAAKNLYQAQPNISIALKELESEIGMQIFWRTPSGMVLTPEGETFLLRAKNIVESMHTLESDYTNKTSNGVSLKLASARSTYLTFAISAWVRTISPENKINITVMEVMTHSVIDYVLSGKADIGIIRIPKSQLQVYEENLSNRKLVHKTLMDFRMKVIVHTDSPLAEYDDIPFEELSKYTEIVHGDDEMNLFGRTFINENYKNNTEQNRICVCDGGNKIMLLDMLHDTYMWAAPATLGNIVASEKLILKPCSYANIDICDIVIYKKSYENNRVIRAFIDFFTEHVRKMLEECEKRIK